MKLRIIVVLVVLALVAGVIYRTREQADPQQSGRRGGANGPIAVRTVPVVLRDLPRVLDLPGTVDAAQQVAIVAQTSGVVQRQLVQEGQQVRKGQLLFTLDARPLRAEIDRNRAALSGALAAQRQAARLVEQLQPLNAPGFISRKEFADARVAEDTARAATASARAALEAAQLAWNYTQLHAPIAGRVGRITVQQGDLVQANSTTPLTTILAPGALDVRASVAQRDWPPLAEALARGKVPAEVRHDAGDAVVARGELVFVDSRVDAATGAVAIKVRLDAPPATLLSGQGVRLRLLLGDEPDVLVIPDAALQQAQEGSYVYVVRNGQAVLQRVKSERELDGLVVVDGGLTAGEPVLTEIPQRLKDGSKVRLESARNGGGRARDRERTGAPASSSAGPRP